MKKRILAFLVVMSLAISLLPVTTFASSGKLRFFYPKNDSGSTGQIDLEEGDADVYLTVVNNKLKPTDAGVVPEDHYLKLSHPTGGEPTVTLKNLRYSFQRGLMFGWKSSIGTGSASALNVPYNVVLEGDNVITTSYKAGPVMNFYSTGTVTIKGTGTLTCSSVLAEANSLTNAGFINSNGNIVIDKGVTIDMEYDAFNGANAISSMKASGTITVNGATINIKGVGGKGAMGSAFYAAGSVTIQNGSTINIDGKPVNNNLFDTAAVTITDSTVTANIRAASGDETVGNVFTAAPVIGEGLTAVASTEVITDPAQATAYDAANAASLKYFKVDPTPAEPEDVISDTRVILGSDLTVQFRADKAAVVAAGGTQVKLQVGNGEAEYMPLTDAMLDGDYYIIPFTGVAAKQMGEQVTATICDEEGNAIGESKTDSVLAYAQRMLKDKPKDMSDTKYAALKTLIADMLNYGAMAQDMFDYDINNRVNAGLDPDLPTQTMADCVSKPAATTADGYLGTAFVLENEIAMAVAMDSSVVGKNCTAKVTFTNYMGEEQPEVILTADETSTELNTVYIFDGLVAADGRCEVTWKFYDGETLLLTVTDSMEAYVGRMLGEYPELASLMIYSDSAKAYFTAQ